MSTPTPPDPAREAERYRTLMLAAIEECNDTLAAYMEGEMLRCEALASGEDKQ